MEIIKHERFGELRTLIIEDEPWFAGKDIAQALGYKNYKDALITHVDESDKRGSEIATPGGNQTLTFVNESGLYSLILSSKLPQAKDFKQWVTKEVLPNIRKHGMYATSDTIAKIKEDPNFLIGLLQALQEEQEKSKSLLLENSKLKPMAEFGKAVHDSTGCYDMAEAAKYLQEHGCRIGRNRLFKELLSKNYIYKNDHGYNVPTQYPVAQGYFILKTGAVISTPSGEIVSQKTLVTPRGLKWLLSWM